MSKLILMAPPADGGGGGGFISTIIMLFVLIIFIIGIISIIMFIVKSLSKNTPPVPINQFKPDSNPPKEKPVTDELLKWSELKEKGVITEEEFVAQKKKLLG